MCFSDCIVIVVVDHCEEWLHYWYQYVRRNCCCENQIVSLLGCIVVIFSWVLISISNLCCVAGSYLDIATKCGHGGFFITVKKGPGFLESFSTRKRMGEQNRWLEVDIRDCVSSWKYNMKVQITAVRLLLSYK